MFGIGYSEVILIALLPVLLLVLVVALLRR